VMLRVGSLALRFGVLMLGASACASSAAGPATAPKAEPEAAHHGQHAGLHKDFSDAAAHARHFDDPARDEWQRPDEVIAHMAIAVGSTVVDLGAGTGYFLERLSKAVGPTGTVLALDVEPKMVEFARRRATERGLANVTAREVGATDPGLPDQSVARILIVNTWHHIDHRGAYAAKLARALAPGGQIWIVDFTLESDHGPPARHRLSAEQVVAELEAGGLSATVVSDEQLPNQYLVRAVSK
jgi:predicted methyltransferase